jgi:hypothetical protein
MNISKCYKLKYCETTRFIFVRKRNFKKSLIYGMFHMLTYIFAYLKAICCVIYTKKEKLL